MVNTLAPYFDVSAIYSSSARSSFPRILPSNGIHGNETQKRLM